MTYKNANSFAVLIFVFVAGVYSCKKDKDKEPVPQPQSPSNTSTLPEFYKTSDQSAMPTYTEIAGQSTTNNKLNTPTDLDFHPTRPNELWVINQSNESTGGSTVIFSNAGLSNQTYDYRQDGNAWHFMSMPTALAFSENGNWATSPGVWDSNHDGGTPFTGPALWSGNLSIYAVIGNPATQIYNGSHLDMLHYSPYSMGIANEANNIFWVFDGYKGNIVKYDFAGDHGPGQEYHDNGKAHRYAEVTVKRDLNVPGHLIFDKKTGWLYICDTGNKRILRVNTKTGTKGNDLTQIYETMAEYYEVINVTWEVFADSSLQKPCGIDIKDNRLFVSDNATGEIIAYNTDTQSELGRINTGSAGIMGLKIGADGKIWYVNYSQNKIYRVDPN